MGTKEGSSASAIGNILSQMPTSGDAMLKDAAQIGTIVSAEGEILCAVKAAMDTVSNVVTHAWLKGDCSSLLSPRRDLKRQG